MEQTLKKKKHLGKILSNHFIKFSLIPILVVEVALIVLYFSINSYISSKNINLLLNEAQSHSQAILENEARNIELPKVINEIKEFLEPIVIASMNKQIFSKTWNYEKKWA